MSFKNWKPTPKAAEELGCSPQYLKKLRESHGGYLENGVHFELRKTVLERGLVPDKQRHELSHSGIALAHVRERGRLLWIICGVGSSGHSIVCGYNVCSELKVLLKINMIMEIPVVFINMDS